MMKRPARTGSRFPTWEADNKSRGKKTLRFSLYNERMHSERITGHYVRNSGVPAASSAEKGSPQTSCR